MVGYGGINIVHCKPRDLSHGKAMCRTNIP